MRFHRVLAVVLAAGVLAGAPAAISVAQDSDDMPGRGPGYGQMMPGWGSGPMMQGWGAGPMMGQGQIPGYGYGWGPMRGYGSEAMDYGIDARLAYLKAQLKITDAQSDAWDKMAEALRSTAEAHGQQMYAMMEQMRDSEYYTMPLPDRMALQESHMQTQLDEMADVRKAVEDLYGTLDEEQKKAADRLLPGAGMGMGMGMMGGAGYGPGMGQGMGYGMGYGRGYGMMGPWMGR